MKNIAYEQLARIGKAVSSPSRLEILDLLRNGARTVECLAKAADLGVANVSRHLQVLRNAGLVISEKQGLYVTYHIADRSVCEFFMAMCKLAEARLVEFEKIVEQFSGSGDMEPVDRAELLQRAQNGEITLIDVRPFAEYDAGHIPGAHPVPLEEIEKHLSMLPADREVVAYCRGPYCLLATKAVELLCLKGFDARRIKDGINEWRACGMPVLTGEHGLEIQ
jgi:rhodanese-related sulfurtransferase